MKRLMIVCLALVAIVTRAQAQTPDLTGGGLVTVESLQEAQKRYDAAKRKVEDATEAKYAAESKEAQARTALAQGRLSADRLSSAVTEVVPLVDAFIDADRAVTMARNALATDPTDATLKDALEEADGKLRTARGSLKGFIRGLNAETGSSIDIDVEPLLAKDAVQEALEDQRARIGELADALALAQKAVSDAETFLTGAKTEEGNAREHLENTLVLVGNLHVSSRMDALTTKVDRLTTTVGSIRTEQAEAGLAIAGLQQEVAGLRTDVQTATTEIRNVSRLVTAQQADIQRLTADIAAMKFPKEQAEEIVTILNRLETKMYGLASSTQVAETRSLLEQLKAKAERCRVVSSVVTYPTYYVRWSCPSGPYGYRWCTYFNSSY